MQMVMAMGLMMTEANATLPVKTLMTNALHAILMLTNSVMD